MECIKAGEIKTEKMEINEEENYNSEIDIKEELLEFEDVFPQKRKNEHFRESTDKVNGPRSLGKQDIQIAEEYGCTNARNLSSTKQTLKKERKELVENVVDCKCAEYQELEECDEQIDITCNQGSFESVIDNNDVTTSDVIKDNTVVDEQPDISTNQSITEGNLEAVFNYDTLTTSDVSNDYAVEDKQLNITSSQEHSEPESQTTIGELIKKIDSLTATVDAMAAELKSLKKIDSLTATVDAMAAELNGLSNWMKASPNRKTGNGDKIINHDSENTQEHFDDIDSEENDTQNPDSENYSFDSMRDNPKEEMEAYIKVNELENFITKTKERFLNSGETNLAAIKFPCAICKNPDMESDIRGHLKQRTHLMSAKAVEYYVGIVKRIIRGSKFTCCLCGVSGKKLSFHFQDKHSEYDRKSQEYFNLRDLCFNPKNLKLCSEEDKLILEGFVQRLFEDKLNCFESKVIQEHERNVSEILVFLEGQGMPFSTIVGPKIEIMEMKRNISTNLKNSLYTFVTTHKNNNFCTLHNKISSFVLFASNYLINENISDDVKKTFTTSLTSVRRFLKKKSLVENVAANDKARDYMITKVDTNLVIESDNYKSLQSLLLEKEASLKHFSKVRGMVTFTILCKNPQRLSALANMTMRNYNTRKNIEENRTLIEAYIHKTEAAGLARITLEAIHLQMLVAWVQKYRPIVTEDLSDGSHVFLTEKGNILSTSTLNIQHKIFARKCGLSNKWTSTSNRKSASTKMLEEHPEMEDQPAKYMRHSKDQARKSYRYSMDDRQAVELYDILNAPGASGTKSTAKKKVTCESEKSDSSDGSLPFTAENDQTKASKQDCKRQESVNIGNKPKRHNRSISNAEEILTSESDCRSPCKKQKLNSGGTRKKKSLHVC